MLKVCPHCFEPVAKCLGKHPPLPPSLLPGLSASPPLWITQAGFTKHGKTTFTAVLTLLLEKLGKVVPGFAVDYLGDKETMNRVQEMRRDDASLREKEGTSDAQPPLFIRVRGAGAAQFRPLERTLILYDAKGEAFAVFDRLQAKVPSLVHSDVTWFLVSKEKPGAEAPADEREFLNLSDLFQNYRNAHVRSNVKIKKKTIIVAFSKVDDYYQCFPEEVQRYLVQDPLQGLLNDDFQLEAPFLLRDYYQQALKISDHLKDFAKTAIPGGREFISLAEQEQVNVHFCLFSALGQDPSRPGAIENCPRYRVLDPLILSLHGIVGDARAEPRVPLRLIVDAAKSKDGILKNDIGTSASQMRLAHVAPLLDELQRYSEVAIHLLGKSQPVARPGQSMPDESQLPKQQFPPTIGPILESIPPESRVIVLTAREVLDRMDFLSSHWTKQVMICVNDETHSSHWPHTWVLRPNDDHAHIAAQLHELSVER